MYELVKRTKTRWIKDFENEISDKEPGDTLETAPLNHWLPLSSCTMYNNHIHYTVLTPK